LLKHNALYEEQDNRYLIDYKLLRLSKKDMTFILGAKCIDGAVMVGDTKVTIGEGTDYTYAQKLIRPFPIAVLGAAGATGLFNSFQSRMQVALIRASKTRQEAQYP
jgi:20S proteasome alpha/beta subunit